MGGLSWTQVSWRERRPPQHLRLPPTLVSPHLFHPHEAGSDCAGGGRRARVLSGGHPLWCLAFPPCRQHCSSSVTCEIRCGVPLRVICIKKFFLLEYSCFTILLVSTVQQSKSAICVRISHHFWISFPLRSPESTE